MRFAKDDPAPENDAELQPRFQLELRGEKQVQALYMALSYAAANAGDILEAMDEDNSDQNASELCDTFDALKVKLNCLLGGQQIKEHYAQTPQTTTYPPLTDDELLALDQCVAALDTLLLYTQNDPKLAADRPHREKWVALAQAALIRIGYNDPAIEDDE